MTCSQSIRIDAYLLDELSPTERAAFEEHLIGCGSCADEIGRFNAFVKQTQSAEDELGLFQFLPVDDRRHIEALLKSIPADDPPARSMALAASVLLALTVLNQNSQHPGIYTRQNSSMSDTTVPTGGKMMTKQPVNLRHFAFYDDLPIFMSDA